MKESGPIEDPAMWGWSDGVYEISNPKHQITNKSQTPIFNDQNRKQVSNFETGEGTRPQGGESKRSADNFGHCNLFDICDLLFGISTPPK
jgi:hypothetical protein